MNSRQKILVGAAAATIALAIPLAAQALGTDAAPARLAQAEPAQATMPVPMTPASPTPAAVPQSPSEIKLSFAPLVKTSAPAVVNVYAARTLVSRSPFQGDPFFEQFFGRRLEDQRPRIQSSLGSGVIVDPAGLIVTNNHVIKDADEVKVALSDGREFTSRILMKDERADLAVLKIDDSDPFPSLTIADSDAIEIGDLVLAIGNPFGIGQTVTNGIVSALARTHIGVNDFGYFIQTDAAINPGNSGGALIDMRGQLVGVNTAIYSRSGGSNGIGFAIPSNMVRVFVEAARNGGRFERPFIGATFAEVTPDIAEAVGLDHPAGSLVESLYAGGPSEKAGLEAGDVVLSIDGFAIGNPDTLGYRLATATAGVGRSVKLEVMRNGERKTLSLALAQPPEKPARDIKRIAGDNPFSGATVANLSPRVADELDLVQTLTGVVVTEIDPKSFAARFGLQPKDIVVTVNDADVGSTADLERLASDGRRGWVFEVERNGKRLTQRVR